MKKPIVILVVMGILLLFTTMIFAASESNPVNQEGFVADPVEPVSSVAGVRINEAEIRWTPHVKNEGLVLTISGPDGLYFRQEFAEGVELTLGLLDGVGAALPDGSYTYELYAIPALSVEEERAMSASRDSGNAGLVMESEQFVAPEALTQSGYFMVDGGAFVLPLVEDANADRTTVTDRATDGDGVSAGQGSNVVNAPSDQVILDDLIVDGSACIGFDCVNGESFGFDTLRLKENNLRVSFVDTSSSASFPSNDWQITANDSSNGGANKFSIDDISGGRTPFTIEASAPSHSLYVDDGGRIGIGTSTPVVEIHNKDGDTPTLRLEQDGSSGFTPQTWDVAGNETNFFIRDATNGSTLPFRIRPGAPSSSIYIDTDGDVGLGTASPSAQLDVVGDAEVNGSLIATGTDGTTHIAITENSTTSTSRTLLELVNNGSSKILLQDTNTSANTWSISNSSSGLYFSAIGTGGNEFKISPLGQVTMGPGSVGNFVLSTNGNLKILGTLTTGGPTCSGGCLQQEGVAKVDEIDLLKKLDQLTLWSWSEQRINSFGRTVPSRTRHISPLSEDFYELFKLGKKSGIAPMDVSSIALLAVKDIYQIVVDKDIELTDLQARNELLQVQVTDLETRLATLEAQVNTLLEAQEGK